ncbi:MAG: SLC45 family MFS transporter [Paludibacter sp.]|jgi:maltose/moltooligosaccharide transporter|nr:SLC45 family MFS transporter [Paludibacter sp.]
MDSKPNLPFWSIWNLSFGFFGVQIAYALQSANISRIFATLGADPHSLSFFWILPPLMGIIVQPIVGSLSDKTWLPKFGRRIPYLFVGAVVAIIVMCLLPNAGSYNLAISTALIFGLIALMFLDTSINMAMQPFKMLVGDMVNEKQKTFAYSIQSFLVNLGSVLGFLFPFIFTFIGISNVAADGVVPDSVIYSFYVGAGILILCVLYTVWKVKEMPPREYAKFHGFDENPPVKEKSDFITLLKKAPKVFWTVGLVQFFCWVAFMYMWTYTNGGIAENVWGVDTHAEGHAKLAEYQEAGNWVGILFAVQAIASVGWALIIPLFKQKKLVYSLSLLLGAAGFISIFFVHNQYLLFGSYALVGCAWAAMLALPFTILTNALSGKNMGAYLGLFNGTICLPQIVAALLGGVILNIVGSQAAMLAVAGAALVLGAVAVMGIKERE